MAKKNPSKKSNYLGFRLSEEVLNKLDLIAQQENKSRGLVAKDAIEQWLNLELFNQNNNLIMISKTTFSKFLSKVNDEDLNSLANEVSSLYSDLMKFLVAEPMNDDSLKSYTGVSIELFGKNGLKWFNTIDIQIQKNILIFRGLHDLDEIFSNYFSFLYKNLLSEFFELELILTREEKTSNLVHLEFDFK
ncbi:MAG: hypothetical protein HWN79_02235 [Candidatus Lokiarchaeota archaeon]|nr:hypothetical protein [Candidatus Lokiarchaeota archaeon]